MQIGPLLENSEILERLTAGQDRSEQLTPDVELEDFGI